MNRFPPMPALYFRLASTACMRSLSITSPRPAIVLELSDRRVRTVDEITQLLGLPALGIIPKPGAKGQFSRPNRTALIGYGVAGRLPSQARGA